MSDISAWSPTAASNNSAAPNGWPEGQLPSSVNDCGREMMGALRRWYEDAQWIDLGHVPTFVSATSFTIPTDVTATYEANRRLKLYGTTMGTLYGTISSSSYAAPNTTVNVTMDSGALTSNLSRVYLSILTATSNAIPTDVIGTELLGTATFNSAGVMTAGTVPLARIQRIKTTNKNSGIVTATGVATNLTTVDLGTVTARDEILVTALVKATKGATTGYCRARVIQISGTATIIAGNDQTYISTQQVVSASTVWEACLGGFLTVTGTGTLVLEIDLSSSVSDSTVAAGEAQLAAIVLNNA